MIIISIFCGFSCRRDYDINMRTIENAIVMEEIAKRRDGAHETLSSSVSIAIVQKPLRNSCQLLLNKVLRMTICAK